MMAMKTATKKIREKKRKHTVTVFIAILLSRSIKPNKRVKTWKTTEQKKNLKIYPLVFRSHFPHSNFLLHHLIFSF